MYKCAIHWLCAIVVLVSARPAHATFHLWQLNEIYSNAAGTVQYIELTTAVSGQVFLAGHTVTSSQGAATHSFTFPSDLPGDSAGRTFLIGTTGFAALGLVTPDYIVPNGFLFTTNGRVSFAGVDSVSWTALPIDGVTSIDRFGAMAVNSPKNFAGATGSVVVLSSPTCTLTATPATISAGGTSILTASCNPAATSYAWSANTGFGSTVTAGTVSPTVTTTYTVTGSNAGSTGNTATATVTVTSSNFLLTVTQSGPGKGGVTSSPAGINCGATCSGSFTSGTNVTLAATPAVGSTFAGWSGACTSTEACTVIMSSARDVTAIFVPAVSGYSFDYVQKAFVAYYGRPGDPAGMIYWAGRMDAEGQSLNAIIGAFGNSDEFNRRYGGLTNTQLVTKIYQQALNRDPDPGGLDYYVGELDAGRRTLQTITLDVLNGATTAPDSTVVANKLAVAGYYTAKVAAGCPYGTEQDGVATIVDVTALSASVTAAKAAIDAWCGP